MVVATEILCVIPTPTRWVEFVGSPQRRNAVSLSNQGVHHASVCITNGCGTANCMADLGPNCPASLKGPFDCTGFPVGCRSACQAVLAPNPNSSPNCCTCSRNTSATTIFTSIQSRCPNSYVYAYDGSGGTALWTCPSSSTAGYTITSCP
ncbi:hypothetical protein BC834DRAFT_982006 [Gloeopeniophorella convolvens]|nr:hypothetical protein BC834DRAFT_982006 [Gloeopeniophorella convolvens]